MEFRWALVPRRKHPNYDGACFHIPLCAETYLKARFEQASIAFGKPHKLEKRLGLVLTVAWSVLTQDLIFLTDFF